MNSQHFSATTSEPTVEITRVDPTRWRAVDTASAFVDETATAARTLFDSLGGARRTGGNLELVLR
ncbi:hypothetical protein AB0M22_29250 [Nocardia sp. NPDC051756]|uniref:hypothetical protein n=1 Tax=Nocardia sp. NPDC051756 TaxID=3154751 RepID=UPI00341E4C70